jgi:hypothetical protein
MSPIAALLLAVLGSQADALVLCATRKGAVVAAERCRKRETALDVRDLGVVVRVGAAGADGPAGAPGAPVERPFRVVDATGKTACRALLLFGTNVQCILSPGLGAAPVQLLVGKNGTDPTAPNVYYDAPGCEGTPHTDQRAALLARAPFLADRLFVPTGEHVVLQARSYESVNASCSGTPTPSGTCCITFDPATPVMVPGAPARPIDLGTLGLTTPLRVDAP